MIVKNIIPKLQKYMKRFYCEEISFPKDEKILVVCPHQDDEILGCGALIEKYAPQVDVLLITNGELGNPELSKEETVIVRNREFDMANVGVHATFKLGLKDSSFSFCELRNCNFDFSQYDALFVPNKKEFHPDHIKTNRYISKLAYKKRIFEYEVWTPLEDYNCYIDFSGHEEKKWQRIKKYESQLKHIDYLETIAGLNRYRGIRTGSKYVECYKKRFFYNEIFWWTILKIIMKINKWGKKIV